MKRCSSLLADFPQAKLARLAVKSSVLRTVVRLAYRQPSRGREAPNLARVSRLQGFYDCALKI